jgi:hypothetical protein
MPRGACDTKHGVAVAVRGEEMRRETSPVASRPGPPRLFGPGPLARSFGARLLMLMLWLWLVRLFPRRNVRATRRSRFGGDRVGRGDRWLARRASVAAAGWPAVTRARADMHTLMDRTTSAVRPQAVCSNRDTGRGCVQATAPQLHPALWSRYPAAHPEEHPSSIDGS